MNDGQEIYLRELDLNEAERQVHAHLLTWQAVYMRLLAEGLDRPVSTVEREIRIAEYMRLLAEGFDQPASTVEREIRIAESQLRMVRLMKEYRSRPVQLSLF